ncbi:basic proline-rich protein-like [Penaeus indicus]|uniref:basic proline-rich protein-like n=1 Tax=Penaeus indicus TaxID=29960 RepID=UPI00300D14D7
MKRVSSREPPSSPALRPDETRSAEARRSRVDLAGSYCATKEQVANFIRRFHCALHAHVGIGLTNRPPARPPHLHRRPSPIPSMLPVFGRELMVGRRPQVGRTTQLGSGSVPGLRIDPPPAPPAPGEQRAPGGLPRAATNRQNQQQEEEGTPPPPTPTHAPVPEPTYHPTPGRECHAPTPAPPRPPADNHNHGHRHTSLAASDTTPPRERQNE